MPEVLDQKSELESTTIGVFRSAATVAGGRRFSFGALVVVGDRRGKVGLGYAKANEVPPAIEKAQKDGRKRMQKIILSGGTIPHAVTGRYGASSVRLIPAAPGTGVVAGGTVRAVLELAGVTDCLTKSYGSTNQKNLAKATMEGLLTLRTRETVAELRGVTIDKTTVEELIEKGAANMPTRKRVETPERRPQGRDRGGERSGGERGGRGGGRGGGRSGGGGGRGGRGGGGGGPRGDDGAQESSGG